MRTFTVLFCLCAISIMAGLCALSFGRDGFSLGENGELFLIRLPRILGALAAGWALGIAGSAQQGLFRNPLADPGLTGVFGGAILGVTLLLASSADFAWNNAWAMPAAAALGSLGAMVVLISLGRNQSTSGLLLAGLGINALTGAATLAMTTWAEGARSSITTAQLGSWLGMLTLEITVVPAFLAVVAGALLLTTAKDLDRLALGESAAQHLGTDTRRVFLRLAVLTALAAGAATCLCGQIAFIGLLAPHLARALVGANHRWSLPTAGLIGSILLLAADTAGRTLFAERTLPASAIIALVGAPIFIWLARRHHG